MLTKLKKLLFSNLGSTVRVELADYEDGLLSFRSESLVALERTVVNIKTAFGRVMVEVDVQSYDASNQLYRALVINKEDSLDALRIERREQIRLNKVMRVSSRHLPGFTATTEDISTGGARVTTSEPLAEGGKFQLKVELDDVTLPPLRIQAEVRWTAKKADGTSHSGLAFVNPTQLQVKTIQRFISNRLAIEKRLHGHEHS